MAKRRGGRRRGRSFRSRFHKPKLAILPMLGFGVAVYKPIEYGLRVGTTPQQKLTEVVRGFGVNFLAYDYEQGKFNTGGLANAYVPIIAGVVAHKILNFTGVNRMLSRHIKVTL